MKILFDFLHRCKIVSSAHLSKNCFTELTLLVFLVMNGSLPKRTEKDSELASQVSMILSNQTEIKYPIRNCGNQREVSRNIEDICQSNASSGRKTALEEQKNSNQSPERPLSRNSDSSTNSSLHSPSGEYGSAESNIGVASNQTKSEVQSLSSFSEPRKKKTRTVFSRSQIFQLESTFDVKRYLSSSERANLAASLQLTETQVAKNFLTFPQSILCVKSRAYEYTQ